MAKDVLNGCLRDAFDHLLTIAVMATLHGGHVIVDTRKLASTPKLKRQVHANLQVRWAWPQKI